MLSRFVFTTLVAIMTAVPLAAADDLLERLATCQDSWFESRGDGAAMKKLGETFNAAFKEGDKGRAYVPKGKLTVAGLPVVQAFPQSAGMGVGFSLVVEAPFEQAKAAIEKSVGKPLAECETEDGTRMCALEVAEKRTVMLMSGESGKSKNSLIGCYYFYEK